MSLPVEPTLANPTEPNSWWWIFRCYQYCREYEERFSFCFFSFWGGFTCVVFRVVEVAADDDDEKGLSVAIHDVDDTAVDAEADDGDDAGDGDDEQQPLKRISV